MESLGPYPIKFNEAAAYFYIREFSDSTFDKCPENLEQYQGIVRNFISAMNDLYSRLDGNEDIPDEDMMAEVYAVGKIYFGEERSALRDFFRYFYLALCQTESGGRVSHVIRAMGLDEVYLRISCNFQDMFSPCL